MPYIVSRVSDDLYWSSTRIFQPEYYGDGGQDALPASHHLPGDLFQYCAGNQCDGKYADGYSVSGRYVPVWDCVLNLLLVAYGQSFWRTFFSEYQYGGFNTLLHTASPGTLILSMVSDYAEGKTGKLLAAVIILGVILGVLAWDCI